MVETPPHSSPDTADLPRSSIPLVVWLLAAGVFALLMAVAARYGFHRDELYFIAAGRRPAWGYVDQPPLTPLLARLADQMPGAISPMVLRILPALSAAAVVVLSSVLARRFGAGRRAMVVASALTAVGGFFLAVGHILSTTTFDLLIWVIVVVLVAAIVDGADPRLWLGVGAAVGIGMQNKYTVVFLVCSLAIGLLATPQRKVLWDPAVLFGALIALAIAAPNLVWQATNGWPQVEMARSLSGRDSRADYLLIQIAILSFFLVIPAVAGFVWLVRDRRGRMWRYIPIAFGILFVGFLLSGGRGYYVAPMYVPLLAAGAIWLGHARSVVRLVTASLVAVGALAGLFIALPLVPPASVGPFNEINGELGESYGWDQLVSQLEDIAGGLTATERGNLTILTANYGQAAAIELLSTDLPTPISGHNTYWDWSVPPEERGTIIVLGTFGRTIAGICPTIEGVGSVTNEADLANDENGTPIAICRDPVAPLASVWDDLRHLD
jgi:4-amino-4-deoxy-L-arabinose transferase-like glycosyltransferase